MQEELESARPLLAQAAKDTLATMEQLQVLLLSSPALSKSGCSDWTQRFVWGLYGILLNLTVKKPQQVICAEQHYQQEWPSAGVPALVLVGARHNLPASC